MMVRGIVVATLDPIASSVSGPVGAAESYSRQGRGVEPCFLLLLLLLSLVLLVDKDKWVVRVESLSS